MNNLNQYICEGNVSCDPELRYTRGTNKAVTNFYLYVDDSHKVSNDGSVTYKKVTSKIPVVAWAGKAEMIAKNFKKGDKVRLVGKIKTRPVERDGVFYNAFEVIVENISIINRLQH